MSPAERPLENATNDHVALSVGDLDTMTAFYTRLGFDEIARTDFATAPVRTALVRNLAGMALELTAHQESAPGPPAAGPVEAARHRGLFHLALHVSRLDHAVTEAVTAGAQLVSGPATNSREDARFAYIRDPEGNLIELVSPKPKTDA